MIERIITDANGRKHITTEPPLHPTGKQSLQVENDQLKAEIERLRLDAARYQWLKEHRRTETYDGDLGLEFTCDFENYNNIDAAIDAAMKENKHD